jgi:hypothetical protein
MKPEDTDHRSLQPPLRQFSSSAAAAPLSPRLPQIHHPFRISPCIKASGLRSQPCSLPRFRFQRTGASQSLSLVLFLLSSSHFTLDGPSPTRSHPTLVEMISKSFIGLLILALTSFVNAAAIPPARQFLLGLVVREGHC